MTLELFAMWIVVGLIVGYLAGYVMKENGFGLTGDLALGVLGSLGASVLFRALGVSPEAGLALTAIVAFIGAAVLIGGQRMLWHAHA
jgi:uncharacterized membrane protein YeaQ/YmgE (transglycosylase-associated protein family)